MPGQCKDQNPWGKRRCVVCACNPAAGEVETDGATAFWSASLAIGKLGPARDPVSKER